FRSTRHSAAHVRADDQVPAHPARCRATRALFCDAQLGLGQPRPSDIREPDEFRLDRLPSPDVAFGFGIHTCTGAQLARIELDVVAKKLLERVPDMELDGDPPGYQF